MKLLEHTKRNKFPVITNCTDSYSINTFLGTRIIFQVQKNSQITNTIKTVTIFIKKKTKKQMSVGNVDCLLLTAIGYVTCSQGNYSV